MHLSINVIRVAKKRAFRFLGRIINASQVLLGYYKNAFKDCKFICNLIKLFINNRIGLPKKKYKPLVRSKIEYA